MLFEGCELVLEILPTTPTDHIPLVPISFPGIGILLRQREVLQLDKERSRERVIVLSMTDTCRMHISANDVNVQMIHRGHRMDANFNLRLPVPLGNCFGRGAYCTS